MNECQPKTQYVSIKELAQLMGLSPRSVKRWTKALDVPPTVHGYSSHRWSPEDVDKLLKRWAIAGVRRQMRAQLVPAKEICYGR